MKDYHDFGRYLNIVKYFVAPDTNQRHSINECKLSTAFHIFDDIKYNISRNNNKIVKFI